ncbi:hypothetical protein DSUL_100027 [Desulfovibrionales bacterium]
MKVYGKSLAYTLEQVRPYLKMDLFYIIYHRYMAASLAKGG